MGDLLCFREKDAGETDGLWLRPLLIQGVAGVVDVMFSRLRGWLGEHAARVDDFVLGTTFSMPRK